MKTRVILVSSLASLVFAGSVARGQSLVDIARKEEARRKAVTTPARVYTNQDVRPMAPAEPASPEQPATPGAAQAPIVPPAGPGANAPKETAQPPTTPLPPQTDVKDEASWRSLATEARTKLERSEETLSVFTAQNEVLAGRFAALSDLAQRAQVVAEMQKAQAEIDSLQKEIAAQAQQIAAIEEQARRAGVPPGWIRLPQG
jgi:hypothetical protein